MNVQGQLNISSHPLSEFPPPHAVLNAFLCPALVFSTCLCACLSKKSEMVFGTNLCRTYFLLIYLLGSVAEALWTENVAFTSPMAVQAVA